MNWKTGAALLAAVVAAEPVAAQELALPAAAPAAAPAEEDEGAPPKAIEGVAASYRTPARDAAGLYVTPNRELSAEQIVWHVRVALNVAALGCRDADERQTVAAYNALLAADKAALAGAATATERQYQVSYGAKWRQTYDDRMTKLYNYFAQTPAQAEFCAAAKAVLAEAAAAPAADLPKLAAAALPRLEVPFLAFYARYDAYREELAGWQTRHALPQLAATPAAPPAAPLVIAAAAPVAALGAVLAAK